MPLQTSAARAAHLIRPHLTRSLSRPFTQISRSVSPLATRPPRPVHVAITQSVSTIRSGSSTSTHIPDVSQPNCTTAPYNKHEPAVYSFFEHATSTWQYIVVDPATNKAVIIDPVLDYSPSSGQITTQTADGLLEFVKKHNLDVLMLLETHAHADHLTAAQYLKQRLGGNVPVAIGRRITSVQDRFAPIYDVPEDALANAFDKLWEDDETFMIGKLQCKVVHLPGHTPDHVGYICGKSLFVGDVLFYPDVGSARADFPGGSPIDLYSSIEKVLAMDPDVKIYAGHDYPPQGKGTPEDRCWSTVEEQRARNVHLAGANLTDRPKLTSSTSEPNEGAEKTIMEAFIEWRARRDKTLGAPRLLHPSLQVNICAGHLPKTDTHGHRIFKIPLKVPKGCDF